MLSGTPSFIEPLTGRAVRECLADPVETARAAARLRSDRPSSATGAVAPAGSGRTAR
ncbi:hypothetical protein [Streptomyces nitrosporeus]|uniref:hypothetical protein n=1 Tax=Streptomyces nitrosporeus TaxID=28894 RepID=UPI0039A3451C